MTLHLRRCVSLFVCLFLLISACSPNKSSKAGSKASGLARNKVELAYDLCSSKDKVFVEAEKPITVIDEMECITENGRTTCTKEDKTKCELEKVELCNELGKDCKDFKFDETLVPCEPSDKSKSACLPMSLKGEEELVTPEEHAELNRLAKKVWEALEEALTPEEKTIVSKAQAHEALTPEEKKNLKELLAKIEDAKKKALTPEEYEKMEVLNELIRMSPENKKKLLAKAKATELKELRTLLTKMTMAGKKKLKPEEQARMTELEEKEELTPEEVKA